MGKNIYTLLISLFVTLFMMTGCGSSSNTGEGTESTAVISIQENQIVLNANGMDFSLPLPITKKLDSTYDIELTDFDLSVDGCMISGLTFSPTSLMLDGGMNTQEILVIEGSFDNNCTPSSYMFTAKQIIKKDGKVKQEDISFGYDYSDILAAPGYSVINISTPLLIGEEHTDYNISMQVLENGFAAEGKTVKLKAFDDMYGTIKTTSTYTVTTNVNGIATFDYLSPSPLPADGTTTTLEAFADMDPNRYTPLVNVSIPKRYLAPESFPTGTGEWVANLSALLREGTLALAPWSIRIRG